MGAPTGTQLTTRCARVTRPPFCVCSISVMGGEQAAGVLHLVEAEKAAREGRAWPADEQEYFKQRIRER